MPTAAELLSTYSTDSSDSANHLTISEDLRTITVPSGQSILGVKYDDKVRRVWFDMPSTCDGTDLSGFDIRINYTNADGEGDLYIVEDAVVADGRITFSWLVGRKAFELSGTVRFNVCLQDIDEDGTVQREFNTTTQVMTVLEGLKNDEATVQPYTDVVAQLVEQWTASVQSAIAPAESATSAAASAAEAANAAAGTATSAAGAASDAASAATTAATDANDAAQAANGAAASAASAASAATSAASDATDAADAATTAAGDASAAAASAIQAASDATDAAGAATTAAQNADEKAALADGKAQLADAKAQAADSAATAANAAADRVDASISDAQDATQAANDAADAANSAAASATSAATAANAAAANADTKAQLADEKSTAANTAAGAATTAAGNADTATGAANDAADAANAAADAVHEALDGDLGPLVEDYLENMTDVTGGFAGYDTLVSQVATRIPTAEKGAASGVAQLDETGKVPAAQLPSYVDDVTEYASRDAFPATGESGKIYTALDTNLIYRWGGSSYVEVSPSLALGETASTAFAGDHGKAAYDHAQAKGAAFASGLYKVETNAEGHVTGAVPVQKADITELGVPGYNTTYDNATQSADGLMSATDKAKLDGVDAGANAYAHPTYDAVPEGLRKVGRDATGHVVSTQAVTKADVTALGIPAQDTTYEDATASAAGLMSAADKSKLDGCMRAYVDAAWTAESDETALERPCLVVNPDTGQLFYCG